MKLNKKMQVYLKYAVVVLALMISGVFYCLHSNTDSEEQLSDSYDTFSENQMENVQNYETQENKSKIYVYICGQICEPGVKECTQGTRLYQLIELAGGATDIADLNRLNLADVLKDGQKIYVPQIGEAAAQDISGSMECDKININEADLGQLMTLPGIGETRAADIIAYRTKQGRFEDIEDIKNVPGIKDAAYLKIKEMICV
ncbi:MAG: helix-hairpin-helix domain-containing protein [Eubacteriales bacterium]|nr:helix-hairpin-helix domain-containing protein [Eubacteriales bacterium]